MPRIDTVQSMPCPEANCSGRLVKKHTREGKPFWACTEQRCNATHGAHADGEPLGVPGDRYTRFVRKVTHDVFDKLWNKAPQDVHAEARSYAYQWLSKRLGMSRDDAHIGRFDVETCDRVIELVGSKDWRYLERWIRRNKTKARRKTKRAFGYVASKDRGFDRRS